MRVPSPLVAQSNENKSCTKVGSEVEDSSVTGEEGALRHIWCGGPCCLLSLFD